MASTPPSAGAAGLGVGGSSPEPDLTVSVVGDPRLDGEIVGGEDRPLAAEQSPPRPGAGIPRAPSSIAATKKFKKRQAASGGCGVGGSSLDETVVGDTRLRREDVGRERQVRTLAAEQSQPRPAAGIRRAQPTAARASKKPKKRDEAADDVPRLQDVLSHQEALAPTRIHKGRLSKSDRLLYQNRLQIPCKKLRAENQPILLENMLTEAEKPRVKAQAYDRTGQTYLISINHVKSNDSYRLVGGWGKFLRLHKLTVDEKDDAKSMEPFMIRVFAFRSPALKVGVPNEHGGPLGLLLVHYHQNDDPAKHAFSLVQDILANDDDDDDSGEPDEKLPTDP